MERLLDSCNRALSTLTVLNAIAPNPQIEGAIEELQFAINEITNRKEIDVTRTDVENYVHKLDEEKKFLDERDSSVIPDLYRRIEEAFLLTVHDTSSDDFQIVAELQKVFAKHARRRKLLDQGEIEL